MRNTWSSSDDDEGAAAAEEVLLNNSNTIELPSTWQGCKDQGAAYYRQGRYQAALQCYQAALNTKKPPKHEQQVLLSNMVACQLKLGNGSNNYNYEAAIETAQKCIAMQPSWPKGYVRLASAYIAAGNRSNDACNALQTALRLDPGNTVARQMLVRELRRDQNQSNSSSATSAERTTDTNTNTASTTTTTTTASQQTTARDPPQNPAYRPSSTSAQDSPPPQQPQGAAEQHQQRRDDDVLPPPPDNDDNNSQQHYFDDDLDVSPSLVERLQFTAARWYQWWNSEDVSADTRWLIRGGVVLVLLYIAAGGRFGLDSLFGGSSSYYYGTTTTTTNYDSSNNNNNQQQQQQPYYSGNYGSGNAYEQYRRTGGVVGQEEPYRASAQQQQQRYSSSNYDSRRASSSSDGYYSDQQQGHSNNYGSTTYGGGSNYHSSYGGGRGGSSSSSSRHYDNNNYYYNNNNNYGRGRGGAGFGNQLDGGSLAYMAILLGVAYVCHLNGINPMHALWMLNVAGGRRHGRRAGFGARRGGPGFHYQFGGGGGGMGYGRRPRGFRW